MEAANAGGRNGTVLVTGGAGFLGGWCLAEVRMGLCARAEGGATAAEAAAGERFLAAGPFLWFADCARSLATA
jgi:hypothetical protein